MSGATGGLNEIFVHSRSPLREVGGGNDHNFRPAIVMRRGALGRVVRSFTQLELLKAN
jgi:hypothetical protein